MVWGSNSAARSTAVVPPDSGLAKHREIGMRQHGERDAAGPAGPGTDLVVVEPDLALGLFEVGFGGQARDGDAHPVGKRRRLGGEGQMEGEVVGLGDLAPDQETLPPAGGGVGPIRQISPVVEPWPFGGYRKF